MAKNESSSLAWFLAGVTAGVVGAILYAPRAGREHAKRWAKRPAKAVKGWKKPAIWPPSGAASFTNRAGASPARPPHRDAKPSSAAKRRWAN